MANTEFSQWLLSEIEKRGLTYTETARRGGISHGRISQVIAGDNPGPSFCVGIAEAFNLPVEFVLGKAGLTSPVPEETSTIRELVNTYSMLTKEEQRMVLEMIRGMYERKLHRTPANSQAKAVGKA